MHPRKSFCNLSANHDDFIICNFKTQCGNYVLVSRSSALGRLAPSLAKRRSKISTGERCISVCALSEQSVLICIKLFTDEIKEISFLIFVFKVKNLKSPGIKILSKNGPSVFLSRSPRRCEESQPSGGRAGGRPL